MTWHDGNSKLIRQLIDEFERRLPAHQLDQLAEFVRQFYETFPVAELGSRQFGDTYAATYGNWIYLQHYDRSRPKVRVFNPEFERHGWQLGHTVVAIVCRDMPFALDSVRGELNSRNITIHTIHAAALRVRREQQRLLELLPRGNGDGGDAELFLYLEINRHTDPVEIADLEQALVEVLLEVSAVVDDFPMMIERARQARTDIDDTPGVEPGQLAEFQAYLDWLADDFTFLGYEYFEVDYSGARPEVGKVSGRDLGLLRQRGSFGLIDLHDDIAELSDRELLARQLNFSKSSVRARVHRRVYPDYVGVRVFDDAGRVVAEHRFLGLYTSRVYTMLPSEIPVVRQKIGAVLSRVGEDGAGGHEASELQRVLEVYPRDELFQASVDELYETAMGICQIQERRLVRLFARRDLRGKFVSCLVFIPRDVYNTELRVVVQELLCAAYAAQEAEFTTFFSESVLTRTHFVLRVDPTHPRSVDIAALQDEIVQATLSWRDRLRNHLVEEFGEEHGLAVASEYDDAFPPGYRDDYEPRAAVADIRKIANLASASDIAMSFYRAIGDAEHALRFRLFHLHEPLALSDVMPILENLGLRVIGERPYGVRRRSGSPVWIHEFALSYDWAEGVDIGQVSGNFQEAFARIWFGDAESDAFNKLILGTGLGWRSVAMLRSYARYLKQIQFSFSIEYIADTLLRHLAIAQLLVRLFMARFEPRALDEKEREQRERHCETRIISALDEVENLGEDRIIRQYVALIKATLRTNFFQVDGATGKLKNYFSFKLRSDRIPDLPQPRPLYEIFVYSPRVEGVHLRTSKVARGGLRWSDRQEDFRTEVLGLVKAQNVKNSVIVPTGAKGGFALRRAPAGGGRDALQVEGINCYRIFVQALLDITDNRNQGEVVPPRDVVRKDDDDAYLVVAADKGTASFSDIANDIAHQYGFWLGDAFASGGSVGYDHKKMAITARGAWVSVERHFRELGINSRESDFTVIGIGDMSGDVFGNGMLMSPHIRLLGAFNHLHIFVDPEPDAAAGFAERKRLFALPRSSWDDYDRGLISEGGGVFKRSAKSIPVSAAMRARFGLAEEHVAPNELISALLRAPVDLLWNGGIGTYVKASSESHADCGDKANDPVRVDARELSCRIIGEGGNLGVTQLARVEYSLAGGRCNTDFIDNSGGVDCSDHEVNIKIALNALLNAGDMTEKQRRELLGRMTDSVAELVLQNNYRQAQAISLAERQVLERLGEYRRLIAHMESRGRLDRALEYIPDEDTLAERKVSGKGLTRPELAVLVSYVKTELKTDLVASMPDDPLLARALYSAFPALLCEQYTQAVDHHRLRREIIATQIANDMVNHMGVTFVERIAQSTGAQVGEVARAYVTAREVFAMHTHWRAIEALDYQVSAAIQLEMMAVLMRLVRRGTRWFVRNRRSNLESARELARFQEPLLRMYREFPELLEGRLHEDFLHRQQYFSQAGVPLELATYVAAANVLYPCLGIIDAAVEMKVPERAMAQAYVALSQQLELDLFSKQIGELKVDNHWQAQAREAYRDDVEWQLRKLAVAALRRRRGEEDVKICVERWLQRQHKLVTRWRNLQAELHATDLRDFAVCAVAIRELLDLAQSGSREEGIDAGG